MEEVNKVIEEEYNLLRSELEHLIDDRYKYFQKINYLDKEIELRKKRMSLLRPLVDEDNIFDLEAIKARTKELIRAKKGKELYLLANGNPNLCTS